MPYLTSDLLTSDEPQELFELPASLLIIDGGYIALELATIGAGTFFGEMPLVGQRMHHAFAKAVEESLICIMSRDNVERLIARKPQVAVRMLEVLSEVLPPARHVWRRSHFRAFPRVSPLRCFGWRRGRRCARRTRSLQLRSGRIARP